MSDERRAFDRKKHEAVKFLQHKAVEIYISTQEIHDANVDYKPGMHWRYVADKFREKHGVEILDTEKLVLYTTVDDFTMKIVGHKGYSVTEPAA